MTDLRTCILCGKPDARRCERCKSSLYCSSVCQKDDWPTHKLLCAKFADFDAEKRPTNNHIIAVMFPEDASKPKLMWLPIRSCENVDTGISVQTPNYQGIFGPNTPHMQENLFAAILSRELPDTYYISHPVIPPPESKNNRCVASITALKPGPYRIWRGPLLAFVKKGVEYPLTTCRDFDMNDFRHLTDFFLSQRKKEHGVSTLAHLFTTKANMIWSAVTNQRISEMDRPKRHGVAGNC